MYTGPEFLAGLMKDPASSSEPLRHVTHDEQHIVHNQAPIGPCVSHEPKQHMVSTRLTYMTEWPYGLIIHSGHA